MIQAWMPRRRQTRRSGRLERGQSLVEVSLAMMFFLIFMLGLLDLGRLYFIYVALEDSAGEAAVFLSIFPECNYPPGYLGETDSNSADTPPTSATCNDPNNALYRAREASSGYFTWENSNIDVDYITGGQGVGNTVRVEIKYPFVLYTPIITSIVGDNTLVITASATQTIMME